MKYVGRHKSRALLGHHFTGADWGGKFVGLSKKTGMTAFLALDDNDHIVETISRLGEEPMSMSTDDLSKTTPVMPSSVKSLETICMQGVCLEKLNPDHILTALGTFQGKPS